MSLPSKKEFELLALLTAGELSGRDLAKAYKEETGKAIAYGTLYVTLDRLREWKWVTSREEKDEFGRLTIYKITSGGREAVVTSGKRQRHYRFSASGERMHERCSCRTF